MPHRPRYKGTPPRKPYPNPRAPKGGVEPDPRTLAREFFGEKGNGYVANTEGFEAEAREPYIDLVSSYGWNEALEQVLFPVIRKLRRELLHGFNLPEDARQREIGFLYYLTAVLDEIYKRAGQKKPAEITKELN